MILRAVSEITIPDSNATLFDHGAFEPTTRRVFLAHTARGRLEVIDHDARRHVATLGGFPGAAGVVADDGTVLVTNRGSAQLAVVDAATLQTRMVYPTGPRPNGVALHAGRRIAAAACIGDATHGPELLTFHLDDAGHWSLPLPGRPRWCVMDAAGARIFLAIQAPAMVLAARLPDLSDVRHWTIPVEGPHGLDIDQASGTLYVACDGGALVQCDTRDGRLGDLWPLPGGPDATFFNPASGLVHAAIGDPGLVQSIDPRTGDNVSFRTARGAQTTALAPPDQLYIFSPAHEGVLVLAESGALAEPGPAASR